MFHMLTCFNLKDGETIEGFRDAYAGFVAHMRQIGLVEGTGPIGERQKDTSMDTDDERDHAYFVIMSFRDRAQVDRALSLLYRHENPSDSAHARVHSKIRDQIFICWQDLEDSVESAATG